MKNLKWRKARLNSITHKEKLSEIFQDVSEDVRAMVEHLLEDADYWHEQIAELRKYPQFIIHPTNPKLAKPSPISRQLERAQTQYVQIMKSLYMIYNRAGGADEDDLLDEMMNEFKVQR